MTRSTAAAITGLLVALISGPVRGGVGRTPRPPVAAKDLASQTLSSVVDPIVGGEADRWGLIVVDTATNRVVYEHNSKALLQPASNEKVLTTAAALDALGPRWTTRTSVYATSSPDRSGVVDGDLVLYGRGDPNLSGRFSATADPLEPFRALAAQLREKGIVRVSGRLVADDSYLSGPPHGSGWAWEDIQWHFGAEVSALSFNDNLVSVHVAPGERTGDSCVVTLTPDVGYLVIDNQAVTVARGESKLAVHGSIDDATVVVGGQLTPQYAGWTGELAVHDPALFAAAAFRRALADTGISIDGPTVRLDAAMHRPDELELSRLHEVAGLDSAPLADLVHTVNKFSQNLHAEMLLRLLGHEKGPQDLPSDVAGVAVVTEYLQRTSAFEPGAAIFDGCGLSRLDRVTPGMLCAALRGIDASAVGPVFDDSLPEAGYDGTLRRRLHGVILRAKTGSLQTAKSLTGFVTTANGQRLAFSIVYNNPKSSGGAIGAIDRIASAMAGCRLE